MKERGVGEERKKAHGEDREGGGGVSGEAVAVGLHEEVVLPFLGLRGAAIPDARPLHLLALQLPLHQRGQRHQIVLLLVAPPPLRRRHLSLPPRESRPPISHPQGPRPQIWYKKAILPTPRIRDGTMAGINAETRLAADPDVNCTLTSP